MNKLTLLLKHLWLDVSDTKRAIPPDMLHRLAERVGASEQRHSGQIRICVESSLPMSYLWRLNADTPMAELVRQRAVTMFGKLRVWDTEHNNGVLIYLLLAENAIEIVADRGLSQHVSAAQWQGMVAHMSVAFKAGRYEDGLTEAMGETSAVLMEHFATDASADGLPNANELPDSPILL